MGFLSKRFALVVLVCILGQGPLFLAPHPVSEVPEARYEYEARSRAV